MKMDLTCQGDSEVTDIITLDDDDDVGAGSEEW